jgi:hemerythrin superfamily protein
MNPGEHPMPKITPMSMLKQDHQKLKALLSELSETTERAVAKRTALRQRIADEIFVHTAIEEEIFYPAFKAASKKRENEKLYFEAVEEHHAADLVLTDLKNADPATLSFTGKAKVLKELIEHHAKEEEDDMFPAAKRMIPAAELDALAESMEQRKAVLMSKARTSARKQNARTARTVSPN